MTVFPVPAPPETRRGPFARRSTRARCWGCRNSCHSAKLSPSMARRRSSSLSNQVKVERAARVRRPAMRSASVGSAATSREGRSPKSSRISSIVAPVARLSSASPCQDTRAVEARSRSWDSRCAANAAAPSRTSIPSSSCSISTVSPSGHTGAWSRLGTTTAPGTAAAPAATPATAPPSPRWLPAATGSVSGAWVDAVSASAPLAASSLRRRASALAAWMRAVSRASSSASRWAAASSAWAVRRASSTARGSRPMRSPTLTTSVMPLRGLTWTVTDSAILMASSCGQMPWMT